MKFLLGEEVEDQKEYRHQLSMEGEGEYHTVVINLDLVIIKKYI